MSKLHFSNVNLRSNYRNIWEINMNLSIWLPLHEFGNPYWFKVSWKCFISKSGQLFQASSTIVLCPSFKLVNTNQLKIKPNEVPVENSFEENRFRYACRICGVLTYSTGSTILIYVLIHISTVMNYGCRPKKNPTRLKHENQLHEKKLATAFEWGFAQINFLLVNISSGHFGVRYQKPGSKPLHNGWEHRCRRR